MTANRCQEGGGKMLYWVGMAKIQKRSVRKINSVALAGLVLLAGVLVYALWQVGKSQFFPGEAGGSLASISVDARIRQGELVPFWRNLAQGGEDRQPRFSELKNEITALEPEYIRIDHVYDFYEPVSRVDGKLTFDWERLDRVVEQITAMGATPFFSLSYMPGAISRSDLLDKPVNWSEWAEVVRATVAHYSGRAEYNLDGVAYEIWNEPDLFGNWRLYGDKDYRQLYRFAVAGAQQAGEVNSFKIGGPSITAPYKNWVDNFLDYTVANRTRIDFYSWHRYAVAPTDFLKDVNRVDTWLFKNGGLTLEKFLTEAGPVADNSPLNDSNFAGAHLVAMMRQLINRVDRVFSFEIYDGKAADGRKYWGRWGLLTHPDLGVEKKPRYRALLMLNKMNGERVELSGEGNWVSGFATQGAEGLKIILVNVDSTGRHLETFPLTVKHLTPGEWLVKESYLVGANRETQLTVTEDLVMHLTLGPNNIVLVELQPLPID